VARIAELLRSARRTATSSSRARLVTTIVTETAVHCRSSRWWSRWRRRCVALRVTNLACKFCRCLVIHKHTTTTQVSLPSRLLSWMCVRHTVLGCRMSASDDNGSHFLTRDPWPATRDYSRVMTPDYCSFQSGPLSGSALKVKHHHCHKIHRRNKWIKLTLWLKLCRKSLQCLKKRRNHGSTGHEY